MNRLRMPAPARTALLAALALAAGCESDPAAPFTIEGTGTLEGRLFLDENRNASYEPVAGDVALADVQAAIRERGTTEQIASFRTDAEGRFSVASLPPGTHDLFIDPATLPEGALVCQNPVPVTVYIGETQFTAIDARGGCIISIEEAEAMALGSPVTVEGIITSFPGQIRGSYAYVEDETGGIRIFDGSLEGQGIEIGDRVELSGTLASFNNDLQLTSVSLNSLEKGAAQPVAEAVTTNEIAAAGPTATDPLQGRLVQVSAAELVRAFGDNTGSSANAVLDDGSGAVQIRIESGVASSDELNSLFSVGTCYDVTGVIGNFNGTAQIFPRSLDDVVEVPCT